MNKEKIEKINQKLDMTEDDKTTINLLYKKSDLQDDYIQQLETKVKECEGDLYSANQVISDLIDEDKDSKIRQLGKGQHSLMQSRRKWKARYYKERRKVKEQAKKLEEAYTTYVNKLTEKNNKIKELEENKIDFATVYVNGYNAGEAKNAYKKARLAELEERENYIRNVLKINNEQDKLSVQRYEEIRRNCTDEFYKKSYQKSIHILNAKRETRKSILNLLEGEKNENRNKI